MKATFNSTRRRTAQSTFAAGYWLLAAGNILASTEAWQSSATFSQMEFQQAEARFHADTNNVTNIWQYARAAFDYAEFSTNDTQRAGLARQGIAASRALIARDPDIAAGHYYLAMNLGQLARTQFLGALRLVREMEREFATAANLDSQLDYAGAERNLGLLYREAPGWPASIGSRRKARPHSEQAVLLAPNYPENHLNLIESYLKWGEPDAAKKQLSALDTIWLAARTNFSGAKWDYTWESWSSRRDDAQKQLEKKPASPSKRN